MTTKHTHNPSELKDYRRSLRQNMTPAEVKLWTLIKGKRVEGLQFRRQFGIDEYILDFYCPQLKLAIELDGDYHYLGGVPEHDFSRDKALFCNHGTKTLRFENKDVFVRPEIIINSILAVLQGRESEIEQCFARWLLFQDTSSCGQ